MIILLQISKVIHRQSRRTLMTMLKKSSSIGLVFMFSVYVFISLVNGEPESDSGEKLSDDSDKNDRLVVDPSDSSAEQLAKTGSSLSDDAFIHGFLAALSVIIVSELGDKTFFIAAIMSVDKYL